MGFKDSFKKAWKRVSDLEDDSEAAKERAREANRIPFKEISKKLKTLMKENVDVVGRKIIIPSYYIIYFNETDRNMRLEVEDVLTAELKEELYHEMRKINPEQNKRDLLIDVKTDSSLSKGEFRTEFHIKKIDDESHREPAPQHKPAPAATPVLDEENDFKPTIIETSPLISDDDQATIIQRPESSVMFKFAIDSGEDSREVILNKDLISIGRSSKDDVVLESPDFSISRSHAILEVRDGAYFLTPSGINGTSVNGKELELKEEVKIEPGDEIQIMNYKLKLICD